jgi:hypothetical protein
LSYGNYKLEVSSVNEVGESLLSPSNTVQFANPPSAPATLTLTSTSAPSLTASWTASALSNGDAVRGYKLYIDDGVGGDFIMVYDGSRISNVYQHTIGSNLVECGVLYNVEVTAINVAGESLPT